jgi:tetratricopeptide (TPR) repeat protein
MGRGSKAFRASLRRVAPRVAAIACSLAVAGCAGPPETPPVSPVQKLNAEGLHRFDRGEPDGAEEMFRAALREAELVDDLPGQAEAWNNLGTLAFARGDLDDATTYHLFALRLYERRRPRQRGEVRARTNLGNVLLASRRTREASDQFTAARRLAEHLGAADVGLRARAGLAALLLESGEPARALSESGEVIRAAGEAKDDEAAAAALAVQAEALLASARPLEARASLERALELDRKRAAPFAVAQDLRGLARVAERLGDRAAAADLLLRCSRISRWVGMLELAERELAAASALLEQGPDALERALVRQELEAVRRARERRPAAARQPSPPPAAPAASDR